MEDEGWESEGEGTEAGKRPVEEKLFEAIRERRAVVAEMIIRNNPALNVNWQNENRMDWAALHYTCEIGFDSVILVLLAHPAIDVNQEDSAQWTPFFRACLNGHTSCVRQSTSLGTPDGAVLQDGELSQGDHPRKGL